MPCPPCLDAIISNSTFVGYLIGYNNNENCFVTPEPLGPGGDPYPAQNAKTDPGILDKLVLDSVNYFREREACLLEN